MHTDDDINIRISFFDEADLWGAWMGEELIGSGATPSAALVDAAKQLAEWAKTAPTGATDREDDFGDPDACPGCGCMSGEGITPMCDNPHGCEGQA